VSKFRSDLLLACITAIVAVQTFDAFGRNAVYIPVCAGLVVFAVLEVRSRFRKKVAVHG